MQKTHITQSITTLTDSSKGQKIAAALYVVTNHFSDTDPLKGRIRAMALSFVEHIEDGREVERVAKQLLSFLTVAKIAGTISEKNAAILAHEITLAISPLRTDRSDTISNIFDASGDSQTIPTPSKKFSSMSFMPHSSSIGHSPKSLKNDALIENKSKRQDQILSLINTRKAVGIKDIALLFTDVSEKTIQRELLLLVEQGKITKRGSKRWSIYMAVGAAN